MLGALVPGERPQLSRRAYEAGISRVFGGIHYRFESATGLEIARQVTRPALQSDRRGKLLELLRPGPIG